MALFHPNNLGKITNVLGKHKQHLTLTDNSQTAPSPQSANSSNIYNRQMAAISTTLHNLAL
jgi:hypothetical protein